MKLHFYFLKETWRSGNTHIEHCECEVIEKPKTYYPVTRFPKGYYGCYVRKEDIGCISGSYSDVVILTERNDRLAVELFLEKYEKLLKNAEAEVNRYKKRVENIKNAKCME